MSEVTPIAPLSEEERRLVARHLAEDPSRVQKVFSPTGRLLWLKRVEKLSWLRRLQKGDPVASFRAERQAIDAMVAIGQPVPVVLLDGPEFIVMADAGKSLFNLLSQGLLEDAEAHHAFAEIGRVLGRLHSLGYAHGRPVIRDFCWDGTKITMIDLERFEVRTRRHRTLALDLVIFAQGWFSRTGSGSNDAALLDAAFDAYRREAPEGPWQAIGKWTRIIRPFRGVLNLLVWLRPRWREIQGALWTLEYLSKRAPVQTGDAA